MPYHAEIDPPYDWSPLHHYAEDGDWLRFAEVIREFDTIELTAVSRLVAHRSRIDETLARRGLVLLDDPAIGEWMAFPAVDCLRCGDRGHAYVATNNGVCDRCHPPGAVPSAEMSDDDTRSQCQICGHEVGGPPDFCCAGRQRLFTRIHGGGEIRQCGTCHGLGMRAVGAPCDECSGTGVSL